MSVRTWPAKALENMENDKNECPQGCGDCSNAAWGSADPEGEKQFFHVIACAAGIVLPGGKPLHFCPFQNVERVPQAGQEMGQDRGSKGLRQMNRPTP